MLYSKKDYVTLSLLAAEYDDYGRYSKEKIKLHLLIKIFKISLAENINIFNVPEHQLNELIEASFDKNSRYYKNRVDNSKTVLLNDSLINELRKNAVKEIKLAKENNIDFLCYEDDRYPKRLKDIELSPPVIFYIGNLPSAKELTNSYAVIGSRKIDEIGKKIAHSFGRILSENNYWNISGLAEGADTYGHLGSLETNGLTGAILAHGLNEDIYPPSNTSLAKKILEKGGFLMSELPPSISTASHFFTRRDRLQSGLTNGVLVVETGKKGGTLHTVNYALKQEKFVGVWQPENIDDHNDYILGNLMLLGLIEPSKNFKIKSKSKLSKITAVKNKDDIKKLLKKSDDQTQMKLF
jgi:DNA processing protein